MAEATTEKYPENENPSGGYEPHQRGRSRLQLVVIGVQGWNFGLEALSYPDIPNQLFELASLLDGRSVHGIPVIEHVLWEGLSGSG